MLYRPKPRVLVDVKTPRTRLFKSLPKRLNLSFGKPVRINLGLLIRGIFALSVCVYLIFGLAIAPVGHNQLFAAQSAEEREALERQLAELESQMAEYESTISEYKKQGKTLQAEIDRLNSQVKKLNLQIKSINLSLKKLDDEISENENKVLSIEESIQLNKTALAKSMQRVYENERASLLMILLKNATLTEFFGDINNWFEVQSSLSVTLERIKELRIDLLDQREVLALKKNDAETLKAYQAQQQASIAKIKQSKDQLLQETKGQESKYQALLSETQKSAAEIRKRIFQLLGGGELTFEEALELAQFASKSTGIRAAMVLAVLDRESALGQNVGRCPYYDPEKDKYYMHPKRDVPVFLDILEKLKAAGAYPPEPVLVSCPISRDGAYGGAMGPAQFIPSTWAIYEDRISNVTGSNPPSPWRNADAFVGTALYLKDAYDSSACVKYYTDNSQYGSERLLRERCAAAKYYAGGNWYIHRWRYGEPVIQRADRFEQDIAILNS